MSLTIQLITISLVVFMVQGVPVNQQNDTCESQRTEIMKEAKKRNKSQNQMVHLYCVANSLHNTVGCHSESLQPIQLPKISINKTKLSEIFNLLSYECKSYTTSLSLKQQLQQYLFNQTTDVSKDVISPLYSILVYLQTMASIWDDIEFNNHGRRCVSLSETEYKMMHYVQYDDDDSLFNSLFTSAQAWFDNKYYNENLESDSGIVICTCDILYSSLDQF